MNRKDLYKSFNEVDDKILERSEIKCKHKSKFVWIKWVTVTACFLIMIGILLPHINKENGNNSQDSILHDQNNNLFEITVILHDKIYSVINNSKSDAYDNYNLEKNITPDLIGKELGTQEIIIQNDKNESVKDLFTLYQYTKVSKTKFDWYPRIIVKDSKGNYYHAIIGSCFDEDKSTPDEIFEVYGLKSYKDIKSIKHRKDCGNKRITDKNFIKKFYQGLITDNWGDNDFLQKNVYQNTNIDEKNINSLYTKYADDTVFLIVELENGLCLDVSFTSHNYVNVFHDLYFKVENDWLNLVSEFK